MSIILRNGDNERLFNQDIFGEAKFQRRNTLGVSARSGAYYIKNSDGDWEKIEDPNLII